MAKQAGIVRYTGTMGGIRHYRLRGNGGWYASAKSGPTREQVLKSPNFERSRENMCEFGGVSKGAGAFRVGINDLRKRFGDYTMNSRLVRQMYRVLRRDKSGKRGERSVKFTKYGRELVGFEWNTRSPLASALGTAWRCEWKDSCHVTVSVRKNGQSGCLNAPKGATHARVVVVMNVVSDLMYDKDLGHSLVDRSGNGKRAVVWSDYIDVSGGMGEDLVLACGIDGEAGKDSGVFVSLGVEFYEESGEYYYAMREGGSMMVVGFNSGALEVVGAGVMGAVVDMGVDERFRGRLRFRKEVVKEDG